jgi:hypothetical protein
MSYTRHAESHKILIYNGDLFRRAAACAGTNIWREDQAARLTIAARACRIPPSSCSQSPFQRSLTGVAMQSFYGLSETETNGRSFVNHAALHQVSTQESNTDTNLCQNNLSPLRAALIDTSLRRCLSI